MKKEFSQVNALIILVFVSVLTVPSLLKLASAPSSPSSGKAGAAVFWLAVAFILILFSWYVDERSKRL